MKFLRLLAVFLLAILPADAGGKRKSGSSIAFHLEASPNDNPKMIFGQFVSGKERAFSRVPEVSTKDIAAFNPFPSQDGSGFGLVFRLTPAATNRISAVSAASNGRWLVARVNGRIVDAVFIDRQITDGELVVWKGVSATEVAELDKDFPRIGAKKPRG